MAFTAWDPANKHSDITLSGSDLTATNGATAWRTVRALIPKSSGKLHIELTNNGTARAMLGIGDAGVSLSNHVGADADGWAYYSGHSSFNARRYNGDSYANWGDRWNLSGYTVAIEIDFDAKRIWFADDNGVYYNSGVPATGTNPAYTFTTAGDLYLYLSIYEAGGSFTLNAGDTSFDHAVSSGFQAGWDDGLTGEISDTAVLSDSAYGIRLRGTVSDTLIASDSAYGMSLAGRVSDTGILSDNSAGYNLSGRVADIGILSDNASYTREITRDISDTGILSDNASAHPMTGEASDIGILSDGVIGAHIYSVAVSDTLIISDSVGALNITKFITANFGKMSIAYFATITGAENGLADIEVPMSSFQGRLRQDATNSLSCVTPGEENYAGIAARIDGDLIIEIAYISDLGVELLRQEIARVNLAAPTFDAGGTSRSVSLSGSKITRWSNKIVNLEKVEYFAIENDGRYTVRTRPDFYLRPYATVRFSYDGADYEFTAGDVSYSVSPSRQTMTIAELNPKDPETAWPGNPVEHIVTVAASNVGSTTARVNGTATPHGEPLLAYFQWGPSTSYGNYGVAGTDQFIGDGDDTTVIYQDLTSLPSGTSIHFRAVGISNAGIMRYGADMVFSTL